MALANCMYDLVKVLKLLSAFIFPHGDDNGTYIVDSMRVKGDNICYVLKT